MADGAGWPPCLSMPACLICARLSPSKVGPTAWQAPLDIYTAVGSCPSSPSRNRCGRAVLPRLSPTSYGTHPCSSSKSPQTFTAINTNAMVHKITAVLALKACTPRCFDRVVNQSSGTTAKGNCNPRMT
jgi:hypothetical protein